MNDNDKKDAVTESKRPISKAAARLEKLKKRAKIYRLDERTFLLSVAAASLDAQEFDEESAVVRARLRKHLKLDPLPAAPDDEVEEIDAEFEED